MHTLRQTDFKLNIFCSLIFFCFCYYFFKCDFALFLWNKNGKHSTWRLCWLFIVKFKYKFKYRSCQKLKCLKFKMKTIFNVLSETKEMWRSIRLTAIHRNVIQISMRRKGLLDETQLIHRNLSQISMICNRGMWAR